MFIIIFYFFGFPFLFLLFFIFYSLTHHPLPVTRHPPPVTRGKVLPVKDQQSQNRIIQRHFFQ